MEEHDSLAGEQFRAEPGALSIAEEFQFACSRQRAGRELTLQIA